MIRQIVGSIGKIFLSLAETFGSYFLMAKSALFWAICSKPEFSEISKQSVKIGVDSFLVTALTSFFTGMVLALQMGQTTRNLFNEPLYVGTIVAFALVKELGPVLTAIVVAGRAGAVVTAEIGTMKVTEQIDALYTLGTNPSRYLIVPRFAAFLLTLPVLTIFADFIGITGGCLVGASQLSIPSTQYIDDILSTLNFKDVLHGYVKTYFFAFMIAMVSCHKGMKTTGGAEGVGKSTTEAVVISMVLVLVMDYFVSSMLVAVGL
ncbi:MAG: ABC transporter permease [Elusimicrobiales bacterium]|nr:ABC transporter permease [Elusimicrobiales bacterium]